MASLQLAGTPSANQDDSLQMKSSSGAEFLAKWHTVLRHYCFYDTLNSLKMLTEQSCPEFDQGGGE